MSVLVEGQLGSLTRSKSWNQSHSYNLDLGLNLGIAPWSAEPETLGNMGASTFPELEVSDVSKSTELAATPFGFLGLTSLGLTRPLIALTHTLMPVA